MPPGCTELPHSPRGGDGRAPFDEHEIRDLFEDDVEGIVDLITLVATDLPKYAAALTAHVERSEWSDAGRVAHTIKGAGANVFAARVAELAETVERTAKQGSTASIVDDVRQLTDASAALVRALQSWAARLATTREVA